MSKNGFGKQGSALLRRRWLARAQKRNQAMINGMFIFIVFILKLL